MHLKDNPSLHTRAFKKRLKPFIYEASNFADNYSRVSFIEETLTRKFDRDREHLRALGLFNFPRRERPAAAHSVNVRRKL